jgi:hypothetical protein
LVHLLASALVMLALLSDVDGVRPLLGNELPA